jgi:hypothetical protein
MVLSARIDILDYTTIFNIFCRIVTLINLFVSLPTFISDAFLTLQILGCWHGAGHDTQLYLHICYFTKLIYQKTDEGYQVSKLVRLYIEVFSIYSIVFRLKNEDK